MKGPGYIAVQAGTGYTHDQVRANRNTPTILREVLQRVASNLQERLVFLTPETRILKKVGSERENSSMFPPEYLSEHVWIRLLPKAIETITSTVLGPKTPIGWQYLSPGGLATTDIYSKEQLNELREHLMFPAEQQLSISNNVARTMQGRQKLENGLSITNLLSEETLDKIAKSTTERVWNGFISFGPVFAGLFGIFVIFKIIQIIIDTIIRCYILHSVYDYG
ncbi:hypothetical protein M0804_009018 [Polistes exclamans]|nr:hypothetical protein M0804_009018 [Polistes exclamans]